MEKNSLQKLVNLRTGTIYKVPADLREARSKLLDQALKSVRVDVKKLTLRIRTL